MSLNVLFTPLESGLEVVSLHWCETKTSDPTALAIFMRHYSCRRWRRRDLGGNHSRFIGPGECMVLVSHCGRALFAWRRELYRLDEQRGVNCSVFRNEGAGLSSDLIREASELAFRRWPGERLLTFVNAEKIRSSNPGFCFIAAGWRRCGFSKGGLVILEMLQDGWTDAPPPLPQATCGERES